MSPEYKQRLDDLATLLVPIVEQLELTYDQQEEAEAWLVAERLSFQRSLGHTAMMRDLQDGAEAFGWDSLGTYLTDKDF